MRRRRREGDRVAGTEAVLVEPDDHPERSGKDVPELVPAVAYECVVRARRTTRLVDGLEEFDVLVTPEHQSLPPDSGVELNRRSFVSALNCKARLDSRGRLALPRSEERRVGKECRARWSAERSVK